MNTWYLPVIARLLTAYVAAPVFIKKVAEGTSRPKKLVLQYFFCTIIVLLIGLFRPPTFDKYFFLIAGVGIVSVWGTYFQWRAMAISLSRDSLFTIWDDIIGVTLSYFILKEGQFVTPKLVLGIAVCLIFLSLFVFRDFRRSRSKENREGKIKPNFYLYILGYSVIWGLVIFLLKYWNMVDVKPTDFIFSWYTSHFLGALVILKLLGRRDNEGVKEPVPLKRRDIIIVAWASIWILLSLFLGYVSYGRAPQVVVQPIYLVGEMILPAIVGLIYFRERKGYTLGDWLCFAGATMGGIMVGTSF